MLTPSTCIARARHCCVRLISLMMFMGVLSGCASHAQRGETADVITSPPASQQAPMTTEHAPVPFDAIALNAGVRPGETWAFALTDADGVTSTRHTEVVSADESGGVFAFWTDEQVAEAPDTQAAQASRTEVSFTWDDLVGHATYPLAATQVTESSETVPAGTFEGWLYTVRQPDGAVVEAFFARALPGPPVRWERIESGVSVSRMVLLYRR